jgi:hypothetical protein
VTTTVAIEGVRLLHNSREGLSVANTRANGTINASVTRSAVANNIRDGIAVASLDTTGKVSLVLTRSMVANNRFALIVAANASLRFGQSVITGNQSVLGSSGSAVAQSFGDNYIAGNADGDIGVLPTIAKK